MTDSLPVVVISGPSGSGKSTVVDRLIRDCSVPLREAVSATTRPIRDGEINGKDYHFLSREEFDQLKQKDAFLEFAEVHGQGFWYGTLKAELERCRESGHWALLEIDVEGALNVMRMYPSALTVFLLTPSEAEFERRLRARGTESETEIARRLQTAKEELSHAHEYKLQVINDELDRAVGEICRFLNEQPTL